MIGPQFGAQQATPDMATILHMLLQQFAGMQAGGQGTLTQQSAGLHGQLGSPFGMPFGAYGALYGTRVPQSSFSTMPTPHMLGTRLGPR